jgi:hypothetical protein
MCKWKVDYKFFIKNKSVYWRQIVNLDKLDVCILLAGASKIPMVAGFMRYYKRILPNAPTKCPFVPANISLTLILENGIKRNEYNVTVDDIRKNKKFQLPQLSTTILPNGLQRHFIRLYFDQDPQGMVISWTNEYYVRMNDDEW